MKKKIDFDVSAMAKFLGLSEVTINGVLGNESPTINLAIEDIDALKIAYYGIPEESPRKMACLQDWKNASFAFLKNISSIVDISQAASSVCLIESMDDFGVAYLKKWRELFDSVLESANSVAEARVADKNRPYPYTKEDTWTAWQKMVSLIKNSEEAKDFWHASAAYKKEPSRECQLVQAKWQKVALLEIELADNLEDINKLLGYFRGFNFLSEAYVTASVKLNVLSVKAINDAKCVKDITSIFNLISEKNTAANKLAKLITDRLQTVKTFSEVKELRHLGVYYDNSNLQSALDAVENKSLELATSLTELRSLNGNYSDNAYREKFCHAAKEEISKAASPEEARAVYENVKYNSPELKTLVIEKIASFFGWQPEEAVKS